MRAILNISVDVSHSRGNAAKRLAVLQLWEVYEGVIKAELLAGFFGERNRLYWACVDMYAALLEESGNNYPHGYVMEARMAVERVAKWVA